MHCNLEVLLNLLSFLRSAPQPVLIPSDDVRGLDDLFPDGVPEIVIENAHLHEAYETTPAADFVDEPDCGPEVETPVIGVRRLTITEQLRLDQEQERDLSSVDYMVRNNRILSESIDNLVERYFSQTLQEEKSA